MCLKRFVQPLVRGLDIDSPSTTHLRRQILREKSFLRKIYEDWYRLILAELPAGPGRILEIGTGAGFLADYLPELITSEIFLIPGLDVVLNSCCLPLASRSLRGIVMTDVLHHIPDVPRFFHEAARCVRTRGAIVMIEPWNSTWSRWVYTRLHHEPYHPEAERWEFPSAGPLSGANGALPWIVFERDQARFIVDHPQWRIISIRRMMPFRYLLSGGVTYRSFMPGWTYALWRSLEAALQPFSQQLAMFALIVLQRTDAADHLLTITPSRPHSQ